MHLYRHSLIVLCLPELFSYCMCVYLSVISFINFSSILTPISVNSHKKMKYKGQNEKINSAVMSLKCWIVEKKCRRSCVPEYLRNNIIINGCNPASTPEEFMCGDGSWFGSNAEGEVDGSPVRAGVRFSCSPLEQLKLLLSHHELRLQLVPLLQHFLQLLHGEAGPVGVCQVHQ